MAGSSEPMMLGIDDGGTTLILRPRMPPDRQPLELADQQVRHLLDAAPLLGQLRLLGGYVVERPRPAEQRHRGLHGVDLIECPQNREDEVRVVQPVGDRRREDLPYVRQQLVVGGIGHASTGPAGAFQATPSGSHVIDYALFWISLLVLTMRLCSVSGNGWITIRD